MKKIKIDFDIRKSLEQLEGDYWKDYDFETSIVEKCHKLRRKPLNEFTNEDFRLLLSQNIGLKYLMPLAINILIKDPLADGDYYEGDLLCSLLRVEESFWKANEGYQDTTNEIAKRTFEILRSEHLSDDIVEKSIKEAFAKFAQCSEQKH